MLYRILAGLLLAIFSFPAVAAPALEISFPLQRAAYQTNERIYLTVMRSDTAPLTGGVLTMTLTGDDASKISLTFPVPAVPVAGGQARKVEHLHVNGWLLRPGVYTIDIAADGVMATSQIELYSEVRQSLFNTYLWWDQSKGGDKLEGQGPHSLGYNFAYSSFGKSDSSIRAGMDYMQNMAMGGGHQADLRLECDWSDPYVVRGVVARASLSAQVHRTQGNCIGIHFHDEPGLTWASIPGGYFFGPFNIPQQDKSFNSAFNEEAIKYFNVKADNADDVARWQKLMRYRLLIMEAFWQRGVDVVRKVKADFLPVTQASYGWFAISDGYYFNIERPMPIHSGHANGYDVMESGYFQPMVDMQFGRMRQWDQPMWYLPTWFVSSSENTRLQQYHSFMMNVQGLATPPWPNIHDPWAAPAEGYIEANYTMTRLGTVFSTMPVMRAPVALLRSPSQVFDAQTKDFRTIHSGKGHTTELFRLQLACSLNQIYAQPVVEEDILDGTLAAHYQVIVLTAIDYLEPKVVAALEEYAASGGKVLQLANSGVPLAAHPNIIKSPVTAAVKLTPPPVKSSQIISTYLTEMQPLVQGLGDELRKLGVASIFSTDVPTILGNQQIDGDFEYIFMLNASTDMAVKDKSNVTAPAVATIGLSNDGRPLYDALLGGEAGGFSARGQQLSATLRFGAGQLRAYARTTRPIGSVQVLPPSVRTISALAEGKMPVRVECQALLLDNNGVIMKGAAPLQVVVTDPLGAVRYNLYRATKDGMWAEALPLAANDPAGNWQITVTDLLANKQATSTFAYAPLKQAGAIAGATQRAVYFEDDWRHFQRFAQTYQQVTLVQGSSALSKAGAERLAEVLKPWRVLVNIVDAATVNKARELSEEEGKTNVGIWGGTKKAADAKPANAGFALDGPSMLIGTPEDNPLIKFAVDQKFLPYAPHAQKFPGPGRGYLSWQHDLVSYGAETVTLIAYDEAGMMEAVGTLYQAAAGQTPLMPLDPPATAGVVQATVAPATLPEARVAWSLLLPDRAVSLKVENNRLQAVSADGGLTTIDAAGKATDTVNAAKETAIAIPNTKAPAVPEALKGVLLPRHIAKFVAAGAAHTAIGYWGGTVQLVETATNTVQTQQRFTHDIAVIVWFNDQLIVALGDGRVIALVL